MHHLGSGFLSPESEHDSSIFRAREHRYPEENSPLAEHAGSEVANACILRCSSRCVIQTPILSQTLNRVFLQVFVLPVFTGGCPRIVVSCRNYGLVKWSKTRSLDILHVVLVLVLLHNVCWILMLSSWEVAVAFFQDEGSLHTMGRFNMFGSVAKIENGLTHDYYSDCRAHQTPFSPARSIMLRNHRHRRDPLVVVSRPYASP